jgi:hypothetical protein
MFNGKFVVMNIYIFFTCAFDIDTTAKFKVRENETMGSCKKKKLKMHKKYIIL